MKKIICFVLTVLMIAALCTVATGCNKADEKEIRIIVPDGAPALAIAKMLAGSEFEGYKVSYQIADGTDIGTKISAGEADIAIMPTNMAANLYNKGIKIKMVAANVYGLLYLVGTEDIDSLNGLIGEKILCTGRGGTPDFVLQYVLKCNGINVNDVDIEYINQGSDAIAGLKTGKAKFAVLGEPAATMACSKTDAKVLFDLQEEWKKSTGTYGYPQACTVVTDDLFQNNAEFIKAFLKEMNENLTWMTEHVEEVNAAIQKYEGKTSFASADVIRRCNIKYVGAMDAKTEINQYLEIMKGFNAAFIGGAIPNDGLYAKVIID